MADYIKWLGHAAFEINLDNKVILIDPWLSTNPKAAVSPSEIKAVDIILVTHDHGDHLGDAVELAKRLNATLVSVYETASKTANMGVKNTVGMNVGGDVVVKGLKIVMTPALHSSDTGTPCGFIVVGSKNTVYHAGDTGFFSDIKYYSKAYPIDVALIPIGSVFTMNPFMAALFVSLFKPKIAIPMHYGTFDVLTGKPEEFSKHVSELSPEVKVVTLSPGDKIFL